jgi:uncharacterized membrane protein
MNQIRSILRAGARATQPTSPQRLGALIGGGALALLGLAQRSKSGLAIAAAGGALVYMGAMADRHPRILVAQSSILVNCSPQEAYQFWHNFENLSIVMPHLESVTVSNGGRSTWIALGPMGSRIVWDAEIVNDRENESIVWQSLPGAALFVEGTVKFETAPANRGTIIKIVMHYRPRSGAMANAVARMLGKYPNFVMRQDLRRFKALVETGEIPTIEGQTHGPRSRLVAALRVADPTRPIRPESQVTEVLNAMRRIA